MVDTPTPAWAVVKVEEVAFDESGVWISRRDGGRSYVLASALHPLPPTNADDEAVLLKLANCAVEAARWWREDGHGHSREMGNLSDAVNEWRLLTAEGRTRRSRATPGEGGEAWVPKAGDRVRRKRDGAEGVIFVVAGTAASAKKDDGSIMFEGIGAYEFITSQAAIEAAREAVVEAALALSDVWDERIDHDTSRRAGWDAQSVALADAARALRNLLTPPSPPDPVEQKDAEIARLRGALETIDAICGAREEIAAMAMRGVVLAPPDPFKKSDLLRVAEVARTALAAMGERR